ncbi:FAD-binding oxidoreductase [Nocardia sp. CS682]|uniref:NAD(P)/FAD-dependent oxidoreductase n=1 Tax=Nocardia sp. CS682 TaxID=1047172 RepID=UPI001074C36B|nr:FAD-dependent oxidoreductase [Nocardia sp. CS682]QBS39131.1 FAD-dependent oxidoreductase [Nocardia sp. CS682]
MTSEGAAPVRSDPDVVVVGGGVAGLFCAYQLRRSGASVTVLERGELGGPQSCSYGNTGFVGTHGAAPLAEPGMRSLRTLGMLSPDAAFYVKPRLDGELLRWLGHFGRACSAPAAAAGFRALVGMKKRSLEILLGLCESPSIAATFESPGIVLTYRTAEGFAAASRSVARTVASGVPLRILGPGELDELEPKTRFAIHGALYNPEGAYLRVPEFVIEFGRLLREMGIEICERTDVLGLEVRARKVVGLHTNRGDLRPRDVVVAAGAWSTECARLAGIGLTLQPIKGYSVTMDMPPSGPSRPVLLSEGRVAMVPLGDRLRIGGRLELTGMNNNISDRRVQGMLRTVREYLPELEETQTRETWSGLRPCTPDGLPLIGRTGLRNLLVAVGYGHIGMGLAPAGGELISHILAGEQPITEPAPLRPDRFGSTESTRR